MSRFHRLLGALTLALFLPSLAAAQGGDSEELQRYVLTDAGLAKYSQATRQMAALPGEQTGDCENDEDSDSQSIDELAAKLDRHPAAKGAIQAAGMTTREYVVFSFALLQTGLAVWAADQAGGKLPDGTSAANVAWYKKNEVNLKKLETFSAQSDCDSGEDDGEDGE